MITAELAIPILTDIQIPDNLPNKQQFKKSFQDLRTALRKEKNPSEEFMKFFPDPQIKELVLNELSPETIKRLMPAFPNTVGTLILSGKNLGAEAAKELALYLPPELRWLPLNDNNIGDDGAKALAEKLPIGLLSLSLKHNNIGDEGLRALLAAISRTDLEYLTISVPEGSPLREQFKNLRNRQGQIITVTFK